MNTIIKILTSELGYGVVCSLISILLTHLLKKLFKTAPARKRYTPFVTLALGLIASVVFYLTIKAGSLNYGEIQSYITIAVFGMEISIAATGIYISIKRIFGKASEDDVTLEELFNTADKLLPQGLLLISNFVGGDLATAETLYAKVKSEVAEGLQEKKESLEQVANKLVVLLNGWTNGGALDLSSQAKMLVQAIKIELDTAAKEAEEALLKQQEKEKKNEKQEGKIEEVEIKEENKNEVKIG